MSALTDNIDTLIAALTPTITTRQGVYSGARAGRFFQGVRIHTNIPADGVATVPDRLSSHPTDQAEDWTVFNIGVGAAINFSLEIHYYNGPSGKGYIVLVWVIEGGQKKVRSVNFGPEARDAPWRVVP